MNSMDYRKVVEYIVDSYENGELVNVIEASRKFDCSVSSIRKCIARLKNSNDENEKRLYSSYLEVAKMNQLNGRGLGGTLGKRSSSLSLDDIQKYCDYIIETGCTLRELEKETGISKSTLYENLKKLGNTELNDVFLDHSRNSVNDYSNDVENNSVFHYEGSVISKRVTRKK